MKKVFLALAFAAFASINASAAIINVAGASVISSTANSVTFGLAGGGAGAPTFSTLNCAPTACTAASLSVTGTANVWDGANDGIVVTYGANGSLTFMLSGAPTVVGTVANFSGSFTTGSGAVWTSLNGGNAISGTGQLSWQSNDAAPTFSLTVNPVPEPGSMALLGSGLLGLGVLARRRRK